MKKEDRLRHFINYSVFVLFFLYIIGIAVVLLIGYSLKLIDDDDAFMYSLNYILWGGVTLLTLVLILMLIKLAIIKD